MATKTWQNGGVNNNWSTDGNWVEGSKPAVGDDVVMSANISSRWIDYYDGSAWVTSRLYQQGVV